MARAKVKSKTPPLSPQKRKLEKLRMDRALKVLKREYPDAHCSLTHRNAFELLIATMLSAQCTDDRVNQVTPALFSKFPTPQAMAKASLPELERLIQSTGFYKAKALSLLESAKALVERHQGKVPADLESLTKLRGVGRKTANVVLGNAYGIPGLVVDTHVGRLSRRLGFTESEDPEQVEQEMMLWVPESDWTLFSHLLISHGRAVCQARKPRCGDCPLAGLCPKMGVRA